jgi:hypothetical protein
MNYSTLTMLRNTNWSLPLARDKMDRLWSFRYVILRMSNVLLNDDGVPPRRQRPYLRFVNSIDSEIFDPMSFARPKHWQEQPAFGQYFVAEKLCLRECHNSKVELDEALEMEMRAMINCLLSPRKHIL